MGNNLSGWLKKVRNTQEVEIDCSTCLDQVSRYVDLELSTGQAAARMPQVKHHLDQCQVCQDEYLLLRDLARMELDGSLPSMDDLTDQLKR